LNLCATLAGEIQYIKDIIRDGNAPKDLGARGLSNP
jgi:hypothetical protein